MSDEIQIGDRFEITVEVTSLGSSTAGVATAGAPPQGSEPTRAIFWKTELLAGRRLPRAIKVGDRVRTMDSPFITPPKGTIEWTDGADALVRWFPGPGGLVVETVSDLTLIPGDET